MSVTVSAIPQSLKDRDQWICWYTEMRDGKETKIPADPSTGSRASTTDQSTWGGLMNALKTCQPEDKMEGLGFVFTESDPYVGIDIDDCRDVDTGEWEDWAIDVLQDLSGYREISPSGTGGHVIVKGEIPGDRNRRGSVEMYEESRYFTMTGDIVNEDGDPIDESVEVKEEQLGLDSVYDQFLANDDESANDIDVDVDLSGASLPEGSDSPTTTGAGNIDALPPEDQERLKKAKSATGNGLKFTNLWRGNWRKEYPGESHSEADMGFCDMLAFWFDKDPERMDRVFRASGLMRNKWDKKHYSDGATYGERTIERAISTVNDVYDDDYYHNEVEQDSAADVDEESEANESTSPDESSEKGRSEGGNQDSSSESAAGGERRRERSGSPLVQAQSEDESSVEESDQNATEAAKSESDADSGGGNGEELRRGRGDGERVADSPSEFNPVGVGGDSTSSSTDSRPSEPEDNGTSGGDDDEEVFHGDFDLDTDGDEGNLKTGGDSSTRGATIDDREDISKEETAGLFDPDEDEDIRVDIDVEDIDDDELEPEPSDTEVSSGGDNQAKASQSGARGESENTGTTTPTESGRSEQTSQENGRDGEPTENGQTVAEESGDNGTQSASPSNGPEGPKQFPWEKAKKAEEATEVFRQLRDYVTQLKDKQSTVEDELLGHVEVVNDKVNRTYHELSQKQERVEELSEENEQLQRQVEMQRQQINVLERVVFVLATEGNTELGHKLGEAIKKSSSQDFDGVPTYRGAGSGILADLDGAGEDASSEGKPKTAPNSASAKQRSNGEGREVRDNDELSGEQGDEEDSESSLLGDVSLSDVF